MILQAINKFARISCRQAHELMSGRMDHPLSAGQRLRLSGHLAVCRMCRRVEKQFDFMRQAMRRIGGD